MSRYPAIKTMAAIDAMLEADQGATYRGWLGKVLPHLSDAYSTSTDPFRTHLGASGLGDECPRKVWYGWRWATKKKFEGRMLRLFNRGHLEEGRVIALLLAIGVTVYQQDAEGKQFRISFAEGHAGGSGDGVAVGIPDLTPGTPCLLEFKTHSDKYYSAVEKDGVRSAKFEHYVQMQLYMRKMGLAVALYVAVNKNTDAIYMELVALDTVTADQFLERGEKIVWLETPPDRINESPGFFKCRMCDHRPICHQKSEPDKNCRTCGYSEPRPGKIWFCKKNSHDLSKDDQFKGCGDWHRKQGL
jgi:hypothetical protein